MILCDLDHLSALRKKMIPSDKPMVCVCLYAYSYCHTISRSKSDLHISWGIFHADLFTKIADINTTLLGMVGLCSIVSPLFKWSNQPGLDLLLVKSNLEGGRLLVLLLVINLWPGRRKRLIISFIHTFKLYFHLRVLP